MDGDASVDLGAQYFTARDERFRKQLDEWCEKGIVARWQARFGSLSTEGAAKPIEDRPENQRYVGMPGMSAICKDLVEELREFPSVSLRRNSLVQKVRYDDDGKEWVLEVLGDEEKSETISCRSLIVTVPSGQVVPLFDDPRILGVEKEKIESVLMERCWAVGVALKPGATIGAHDLDAIFVNNSNLISWISRESSKPGRSNNGRELWTIHARPEYSADSFDNPKEEVFQQLWEEFCHLAQHKSISGGEIESHSVMRWKFAKAKVALTERDGILSIPQSNLVICGDWVNGSRVEGAYLSGLCAGQALCGKSDARL
eukprot:TRINITY_DN47495_c0_g1_i1.p1 TRINITY_DN47495_c0_g1~~TRINITY_DN47495_c0_g1_i1.p1  ORF type:complete len:368 (+),score=81.76 TRINITY_DN47495_c0_g1_i1:162-1106(+)